MEKPSDRWVKVREHSYKYYLPSGHVLAKVDGFPTKCLYEYTWIMTILGKIEDYHISDKDDAMVRAETILDTLLTGVDFTL